MLLSDAATVLVARSYLVLLCAVVDGVSVPGVRRGGAGGAGAPALLLQEGLAVGVELAADGVGGAHGQVRLRVLRQGSVGGHRAHLGCF